MGGAQSMQIGVSLIWLLILVGPPLALTILTSMFYLDAATRDVSLAPVRTDNRAMLLVLLVSFTVWVMLLKYLYLPLIGFDSSFLSVNAIQINDYTNANTLRTLWERTRDWATGSTGQALSLISFPLLLSAGVLFVARSMGRAAATPPPPHHYTEWYRK